MMVQLPVIPGIAIGQQLRFGDRQFFEVGNWLGEAGHFNEGIAVLDAGLKAHPDSERLQKLLKSLGDKAAEGGDPEALEKLKGLGYVGD